VADDEEDMRVLVRALLEADASGISVAAEAGNGADALARWREVAPDVVILDQRMPDLTGMEVAEHILQERPGQAIVLFSAYLTDEARAHVLAAGVDACIAKEDIFSLPDVVRRVAAARRQPGGSAGDGAAQGP
jgi:CheY-like chemotaxis protein